MNVLGANRYGTIVDELRELVSGHFGTRPARSTRRSSARSAPRRAGRAGAGRPRFAAGEREGPRLERGGAAAAGAVRRRRRAAAALDPRARQRRRDARRTGPGASREERIRAVVKIVQETGIDEITVEEGGMRVSVRRTPELPAVVPAAAVASTPGAFEEPRSRRRRRVSGASRARWSGRSTRRPAGRAAVRAGGRPGRRGTDAVHPRGDEADEPGQGGGRGIVRRIHVENAAAVEYGQLLFELEPTNGRPLGI